MNTGDKLGPEYRTWVVTEWMRQPALVSWRGWGLEFLAHPAFERVDLLWSAEEVLHQFRCGFGCSRLEYGSPVAHGGRPIQQVFLVELGEEVDGDDLVENVGVVVGSVAGEVGKGSEEMVALDSGEGAEALEVCLL